MAGTEAKRVESRRTAETFTTSDGAVFAVPPVPWRARNKLADLVVAQGDDSIKRAIVTEKGAGPDGEDVVSYHIREAGIDYEGIIAIGLGQYVDPVTPEPLSDAMWESINHLGYPDMLGLVTTILQRNGLERLIHFVDLGKPHPESFLETLGFTLARGANGEQNDDGPKTSSALVSPLPDSPEPTPIS